MFLFFASLGSNTLLEPFLFENITTKKTTCVIQIKNANPDTKYTKYSSNTPSKIPKFPQILGDVKKPALLVGEGLSYVQVTKYLEYKGKFSTCLRTQAGRLFGVWGALLHFNIDKSYKKLVKSTQVVRVPLQGGTCFVVLKMPIFASKKFPAGLPRPDEIFFLRFLNFPHTVTYQGCVEN